MAKRGSTLFSVSKIAKPGLITQRAQERILELESHIVTVNDEDVVVSDVASSIVTVSVVEEKEEKDLVALVRLLGCITKRRFDQDSESLEVTADLAVVKRPLDQRGSAELGGEVGWQLGY